VLKITFINVGYGESILLETGENNSKTVILIDGGSGDDAEYNSGSEGTTCTGRIRTKDYLSKRGIDVLDIAIVTHAHEDHVCGLEQFAAAGGRIKKLLTVRKLPQNRGELATDWIRDSGTRNFFAALNSYSRLLAMMEEQGAEVIEIDDRTGTLRLAEDLDGEILAPSFERAEELFNRITVLYRGTQDPVFMAAAEALGADLNDYSLVLMLCYKGGKFLLPGDAAPERLFSDICFRKALAAGKLQAQMLKLAHHGQADSVNETFIKAVSPSLVVTCASSDRRYQSANPFVYTLIEDCMSQKGIKPVFLFSDCIDDNPWDYAAFPRKRVEITMDGESTGFCYIPTVIRNKNE